MERARREATRLGASLTFGVADVRELDRALGGHFDVVLSCDNSLPHLLTDADLADAARALHAKTRPGGMLVASTRDYDALLADRPRCPPPYVIDSPDGRRVVLQVWDWESDSDRYRVSLFIVRQTGSGWTTRCEQTAYRALRRDSLSSALARAGFVDIRWSMPEESEYFQPLVTALKPA